jgi:hypothetical protein
MNTKHKFTIRCVPSILAFTMLSGNDQSSYDNSSGEDDG